MNTENTENTEPTIPQPDHPRGDRPDGPARLELIEEACGLLNGLRFGPNSPASAAGLRVSVSVDVRWERAAAESESDPEFESEPGTEPGTGPKPEHISALVSCHAAGHRRVDWQELPVFFLPAPGPLLGWHDPFRSAGPRLSVPESEWAPPPPASPASAAPGPAEVAAAGALGEAAGMPAIRTRLAASPQDPQGPQGPEGTPMVVRFLDAGGQAIARGLKPDCYRAVASGLWRRVATSFTGQAGRPWFGTFPSRDERVRLKLAWTAGGELEVEAEASDPGLRGGVAYFALVGANGHVRRGGRLVLGDTPVSAVRGARLGMAAAADDNAELVYCVVPPPRPE